MIKALSFLDHNLMCRFMAWFDHLSNVWCIIPPEAKHIPIPDSAWFWTPLSPTLQMLPPYLAYLAGCLARHMQPKIRTLGIEILAYFLLLCENGGLPACSYLYEGEASCEILNRGREWEEEWFEVGTIKQNSTNNNIWKQIGENNTRCCFVAWIYKDWVIVLSSSSSKQRLENTSPRIFIETTQIDRNEEIGVQCL